MNHATAVNIAIGAAAIIIALLVNMLWQMVTDGLGVLPDNPVEFEDAEGGEP